MDEHYTTHNEWPGFLFISWLTAVSLLFMLLPCEGMMFYLRVKRESGAGEHSVSHWNSQCEIVHDFLLQYLKWLHSSVWESTHKNKNIYNMSVHGILVLLFCLWFHFMLHLFNIYFVLRTFDNKIDDYCNMVSFSWNHRGLITTCQVHLWLHHRK